MLITVLLTMALVLGAGPAHAVSFDDEDDDFYDEVNRLFNEYGLDDVNEGTFNQFKAPMSGPEGPCDPTWPTRVLCLQLEDIVEWVSVYPDKVVVGDKLAYTGWVQNVLEVPMLVELEYTLGDAADPASTDMACSITKFATDSATPQLGSNRFLLAPAGHNLTIDGVGLSSTVSFQMSGTADVPGNCTISLMAAIASTGVAVGTHTMTSKVVAPLPTAANMGTVTFDCALESITDVSSDQIVKAGTVDLKLEGLWADKCGGSKASWIGFAGVVVDTQYQDGYPVYFYEPALSVAAAADPELNTASLDLEPGTYELDVHAQIIKGGWRDHAACIFVIIAVIGGLLAISAATGGLAIAAAALGAMAAIGGLLLACDFVIENHTYTVTVEAKDPDLDILGIPDLDGITSMTPCLEDGIELSDGCGPDLPDVEVPECLGESVPSSTGCKKAV